MRSLTYHFYYCSRFKQESERYSGKKVSPTIFLVFFHFQYFLSCFFTKSVENFILNKMSRDKFQSDENYRFFMIDNKRQILVVFSYFWII